MGTVRNHGTCVKPTNQPLAALAQKLTKHQPIGILIGRTELTTNHMVFFYPVFTGCIMTSQGNAWRSTLIQPRDGMKPVQNRIVRSQVTT